MTPLYELEAMSLRDHGVDLVRDITLSFPAGQLAAVLGPNGAGKTTLLNLMAGLTQPSSGTCTFDGTLLQRWPRRALARRVAFVGQTTDLAFPFTAEQVVLMGRAPFCDRFFESREDFEVVEQALRMTGALHFRSRDFRTLSGGEKQRVVLAAALAQTPQVLLLDEPASSLDVEHQLSLYRLLRELCSGRRGLLAVVVTHDLNLSATMADRMILLRGGKVVADGPPARVMSNSVLQDVFSVDMTIQTRPGGRPWVTYGE